MKKLRNRTSETSRTTETKGIAASKDIFSWETEFFFNVLLQTLVSQSVRSSSQSVMKHEGGVTRGLIQENVKSTSAAPYAHHRLGELQVPDTDKATETTRLGIG